VLDFKRWWNMEGDEEDHVGMFPDEGGSSQEPLEGSQDERNLPHRKRSFIQMLMDNPKDTLDHARLDEMGEGYVPFFPSHLIAPYLSNFYFIMLLLLCFLLSFLYLFIYLFNFIYVHLWFCSRVFEL
jgi:hypothetical protein